MAVAGLELGQLAQRASVARSHAVDDEHVLQRAGQVARGLQDLAHEDPQLERAGLGQQLLLRELLRALRVEAQQEPAPADGAARAQVLERASRVVLAEAVEVRVGARDAQRGVLHVADQLELGARQRHGRVVREALGQLLQARTVTLEVEVAALPRARVDAERVGDEDQVGGRLDQPQRGVVGRHGDVEAPGERVQGGHDAVRIERAGVDLGRLPGELRGAPRLLRDPRLACAVERQLERRGELLAERPEAPHAQLDELGRLALVRGAAGELDQPVPGRPEARVALGQPLHRGAQRGARPGLATRGVAQVGRPQRRSGRVEVGQRATGPLTGDGVLERQEQGGQATRVVARRALVARAAVDEPLGSRLRRTRRSTPGTRRPRRPTPRARTRAASTAGRAAASPLRPRSRRAPAAGRPRAAAARSPGRGSSRSRSRAGGRRPRAGRRSAPARRARRGPSARPRRRSGRPARASRSAARCRGRPTAARRSPRARARRRRSCWAWPRGAAAGGRPGPRSRRRADGRWRAARCPCAGSARAASARPSRARAPRACAPT